MAGQPLLTSPCTGGSPSLLLMASGSLVALMLPTPYPATLKRQPSATLIQTVGRGLFKPQHPRQEAHTQDLRPSLASPSDQGQHHLLFSSWPQHPGVLPMYPAHPEVQVIPSGPLCNPRHGSYNIPPFYRSEN